MLLLLSQFGQVRHGSSKAASQQKHVFHASKPQVHICHDYHEGGYAKISEKLVAFIDHFNQLTDIKLEPVYSGKMFYGLYQQISNNLFEKGTRIIAIHTGGMQGLQGMSEKMDRLRTNRTAHNEVVNS